MRVDRIKEDVTALSYEIFRRQNIWIRFRIKLYQTNPSTKESRYYHNEYNTGEGYSVIISPKSYVQLNLGPYESNEIFFIPEDFLSRIVRKTEKLCLLLDAYDEGEIDILKINSNGTYISNTFPKSIAIKLGTNVMKIDTVYDETDSKVKVVVSIDNKCAILFSRDFICLHRTLGEINYVTLTAILMTYHGAPQLGAHLNSRGENYQQSYQRLNVSPLFSLKQDLAQSTQEISTHNGWERK